MVIIKSDLVCHLQHCMMLRQFEIFKSSCNIAWRGMWCVLEMINCWKIIHKNWGMWLSDGVILKLYLGCNLMLGTILYHSRICSVGSYNHILSHTEEMVDWWFLDARASQPLVLSLVTFFQSPMFQIIQLLFLKFQIWVFCIRFLRYFTTSYQPTKFSNHASKSNF